MSDFMSSIPDTHLSNPFVGLRAFEESEDYLFFGRSTQIGELLQKLNESRFLAVIGSSGSGKSSLVKSGLLPSIYSGFMTVGSNWRAVLIRPGEDPIGYLTKELSAEGMLYAGVDKSDIPYESIIESTLRRSENGLVQAYKEAHLPAHEHLLIVVDQFEELFRFSRYEKENNLGKSDAIHFVQILLTAVLHTECPIYVLLTMRADFLGDCAEFRGLPEAINEGQYLVPRMKRDEIREAITGPVAVSTATITQRLVTRLLNDINNDTDQLPILQHALMRTWDSWYKRNQHDTPIDFEDYENIGTMKAALSLHADEAFADLHAERDQPICESMFKALTDKAADVRGVRRPKSIADLSILSKASEAEVIHVVEVFRREGRTFLMPPPRVGLNASSIIDISHESLMRIWNRLAKWIEEEARNGDIYLRLAHSAQLKEQQERGLLKNPELEIALRWKEQHQPTEKWAEGYKGNFKQAMTYLEDSQKEDLTEKEILAAREATRKRLVKAIFLLLGLMVIASVIAAIISNQLKTKAQQEAKKAELATLKALESDRKTKTAFDSLTKKTEELKIAIENEHLSDSISRKAIASKQQSDSLSQIALKNELSATQKQHEADKNAATARQKTIQTLKEKQYQNLKIAANEYARLIREGPSEENKNKDEFYGRNYFLVYTYHFNQLERLLANQDKSGYASLKSKLYYNNDLYKRIYENFSLIKYPDEVVKRDETLKGIFSTSQPTTGNGNPVIVRNSKGLRNIITINNGSRSIADTLNKKGHEFISLVFDARKKLTFCSTNDNFIYVFNDKLERVDMISMGAKVTALDVYNDNSRSIIYFGTSSGYIGYINYDVHKKNQPIFENKLESAITAIKHFSRGEETFLLATGIESSPRVYRIDDNSLKPDKLLLGNELPYNRKEFGNIMNADYNPKIKKIVLLTTTGTYSWNPFTDELLDKLKQKENFYRDSSHLAKETKFY